MIVNALAAGAAVAGRAGVALLICYALCPLVLDRRRLAAWESAWSLTGLPVADPHSGLDRGRASSRGHAQAKRSLTYPIRR
jgi:hypothetical protein